MRLPGWGLFSACRWMALCLAFAVPELGGRKIEWKNDKRLDISRPSIPVSSRDAEAKLQRRDVGIIEDEFDERGIIDGINWSSKLRSELIDFLRDENSELDEKVEGTDPPRHRRDVSGVKEENDGRKGKGKEKKGEEGKKVKTTTLEPSVARKVQNNETRPKDQEQMIGIELPAGRGVRTGQNTKLFHPNDNGLVNTVGKNFAANKALINKENDERQRPRFHRRGRNEAEERKVRTAANSPPLPNSRGRRYTEEPSSKYRIEFEKMTLQFEHLAESQKARFCSYLKRGSIAKPLEMLMALLGEVYFDSGEESIGHWDRTRSIELTEVRDKKARQELVLKWACEDWIRGKDRIYEDALRSMGISRSLTDDRESGSSRNVELPSRRGREDPILEVRLGSSGRRVSEENQRTVISSRDRQQDGFVFSLKLSGDNRVTKQVRVIIDMDEDTRDYQN